MVAEHSEAGRLVALGVDVGGTFTDAVLTTDGSVVTAKVPTTPEDQSEGVLAAVDLALTRAAIDPAQVTEFAHGMTVATNALLESRGARTALIATKGFEDVLELARQSRPELYKLCVDRPTPLVPPNLRFGARERCDANGVVEALDEESVESLLGALASAEVQAVAISLLHSYAHPEHEQAVERALRQRLPHVHVSRSSELLSVFREYERTSTTVIDAYLSPLLGDYLQRLAERASAGGLPEPQIMQSSGGLMQLGDAARHAAWTVLSGPAAGAVAAGHIARLSGDETALSFDMGGTSCDVSAIDHGQVQDAPNRELGGRTLQLPMLAIHTVGAGGGSIGWADAGGALRVGPQSAGADPGPACYGKGGTEPTVTDANLYLGYLGPDSMLAGDVELDASAAGAALERLGEQLGMGAEQTAKGILRVADHEMVRALRVVTVERGIDPRGRALVAFGGAGPMHAARIAADLEIERVLCPRSAGVLSALGLIASDRRRDLAQTVLLHGKHLTTEGIEITTGELAKRMRAQLPGATLQFTFDLRYRGQAFELPISAPPSMEVDELRRLFNAAHEARYGYSDDTGELELVTVRVTGRSPRPTPQLTGVQQSAHRTRRDVCFDGTWINATVVQGQLSDGEKLAGPAVIESNEATLVVPTGWVCRCDAHGTVSMEPER